MADWPGYFPNGPPLHWAASSDDVDVAEALINGGANVEAPAGSMANGTPLDNAVGYGCWRVARLLVDRGARVTKLYAKGSPLDQAGSIDTGRAALVS